MAGMAVRESSRASDAPLRCDHCGRLVRPTEHTRTSYVVDYYSLHSGDGEICSIVGDDGQRGGTYVKLLSRFDVITCRDCYRRAAVQLERERRFHPESEPADEGTHDQR